MLATEAVSSGGRSGLGGVIPVNLLASKEKQQAHELLGDKGKWEHPLVWRATFKNGLATERAHGGGLGRSWRRTEKLRRLGGLEKELGGALSSQGGGERCGVLNLA